MADVNTDDDKTLEQSNSGESDNHADSSDQDIQQDDVNTDGNASEDDDSGDAASDEAEGSKSNRSVTRHERYIDKLSAEIRQSNDQSNRYTEEIFSPKPYQPIDYRPDEEYDPKQLEDDRKALADNRYAEGMQQGIHQGTNQVAKELWADRFDTDSERVTTKYTDLNPESEKYDAKLEADLVQGYIAFTGVQRDDYGRVSIAKPNIRFRDYVDAEMKRLTQYAERRAAESSKNLVKQASHTGVRPSGQARTSKGGHGFDPGDAAGSVARMTSKQYFELGGKEASDEYLSKQLNR